MRIECKRPAKAGGRALNSQVVAEQLQWSPRGSQLKQIQESKYLETSKFRDFWTQKAEQYHKRQATQLERQRAAGTAGRRGKSAKNVSFAADGGAKLDQKANDAMDVDAAAQEDATTYPDWVRGAIRPLFADILLCKLSPGQVIDLELHAKKGIGKVHTKWSPVGTASYRLMPEIIIKKPIRGQDAVKFQKCFAKGVIELQEVKLESGEKTMEAVVVNPRLDTVSRECLRHAEFQDKVQLTRIRDHFICKQIFICFKDFMADCFNM